MKELDLFRFVNGNSIEYHWHFDNVIMFVPTRNIDEWIDLLGCNNLDGGMECTMKYKYFCFWMKDICDSYDIDMSRIFTNKE